MAGRIRDEDVALVRERANIADVVGEHVALRNAGGGSLKGLCPFHEEKTPSFHVTPARGFYFCFGCSAGGDVIDFVRRIDNLSFAEAVEWLAGRSGVALRYEEGGYAPGRQQGQRTRLVQAHQAAAQFYAEQLAKSAQAGAARQFLEERGFDRAAAEQFGVGYAPAEWETLTRHLRSRGFTETELITGGLSRQGQRGVIDRFRGRLMWPIRDLPGDVIGFGARRLREDDSGPKYLNTPETPIYHKSSVLYGVDLAKRDIARRMQAVVVEGYTDVMACHLSGVGTAVATCGTSFGAEHVKLVRRLLSDQSEFRGEVIFAFDGDEAGRKAALKAFEEDQRFVAQTYVAVQPDGLDPCELRQLKGPEAVRDLVARRVPLFEFAIRGVLDGFNLDTPEGRVGALHGAAPLVADIKDRSLRPEYARALAGWLGMEVEAVTDAIARAVRRTPEQAGVARSARPGVVRRDAPVASPAAAGATGQRAVSAAGVAPGATAPASEGEAAPSAAGQPVPAVPRPDPGDPALLVEREALKIALQRPELAAGFDQLDGSVFTAPAYAAVHGAIRAVGGTSSAPREEPWVARVVHAGRPDTTVRLIMELAVEPMRTGAAAGDGVDARYAAALLARLEELAVTRRVVEVKSRLQRLNPVEQVERYNRLFGELVALEQQRRLLRERAFGAL